jgi:raffinose/stachyose/melibiose transport system substrate-binding protein
MFQAGTPMVSAGVSDISVDLSNESWVANQEDWAKVVNSVDGVQYGFSTWGVDYEGVMYNKSYFDENKLSVPKTWDEFVALCDQILALGKIPLYENINGVWHTQSWLYGLTPALLKENPDFIKELNSSKDNKYADSALLIEALTKLKDFFGAKVDGQPKYYTNDGQSEDFFGSYPAMINRDNVMMFTYSAYVAEIESQGSKDEWGMFPLPIEGNDAVVSNGGGISKYINKSSDNVDKCLDLFDFLARPENLEAYYGARKDLVTASFKGVTSVSSTSATIEAQALSNGVPPAMLMKDVLYWDPDIYKYFQGFAEGSTSVEQFVANMDNYRATMFDAVAEAQ